MIEPSARRGSAMKTLRNLVRGYFVVGTLLAGIMAFSYGWGTTWGALLNPPIVISSVLRAVAWAPSFGEWLRNPQDYSFGEWLAPGFYVEIAKRRAIANR